VISRALKGGLKRESTIWAVEASRQDKNPFSPPEKVTFPVIYILLHQINGSLDAIIVMFQ